ncbi:AraC family transcriptional regulator [Paenibacillus ginsengarvi]|uniref:AraC family transcriptional regulator n=1 Tax=Paenibacillus ginsengarvi TaxID=400777 RepID=A0A3B0CMA7_9BACL|nr:AraC family transcriptional regulator [Paenibacillus ginsengarvi]RKN86815.1 AraC family transcriptional regulator [Paenibacillus ginsengarvi]
MGYEDDQDEQEGIGHKRLGVKRMKSLIRSSGYMKDEFPFWITRIIQGAIPEHGHEFVELVYVVHGSGIHIFEGTEYEIGAGDVYIINPGETHAYSVPGGEPMEIVNCLFMPSLIPDALLKELQITSSMDYFYVHPFMKPDVRFNRHLNLHGQDAMLVLGLLDGMRRELGNRAPGHTTIIRLQLIELLVLLSRYYSLMQHRGTVSSPRRLEREITARRIYGYLERNYDKKITLESLAGLFNVGVRQLNRLVRQEFDRSVIDVLHTIRIDRAKRLLIESDEKVISVAALVGYEDPSFFSRLFLRQAGCTPTQYRQSLEHRHASQ